MRQDGLPHPWTAARGAVTEDRGSSSSLRCHLQVGYLTRPESGSGARREANKSSDEDRCSEQDKEGRDVSDMLEL